MNDLSQYEAISHLMKTGDLIEWASNGLIGQSIMRVTGKKVSHCSAVVILEYAGNPRRHIIEANRYGVQFSLLSDNLRHYDGTAYWYGLREQYDEKRPHLGLWLFDQLAAHKEYDFGSILKQAAKRVSVEASRWFCSELYDADLIFNDIIEPDPAGARRPGDFSQLGIFRAQAHIL
jgi:hypothetical protein